MLDRFFRYIIRNSSIIISTFAVKVILKTRGFEIPKNLRIDGITYWKISKMGLIRIGDSFKLNSRSASNLVGITNRASFQIIDQGKIYIGDNCGFTSTVLSARTLIRIGNFVKIGANTRIFDHDYHSLDYLSRRDQEQPSHTIKTFPIVIHDDVFIGTNVIILKGTTIGARSIIGAGSVLFGLQIPEDSIVYGNPARIVKSIK